MADSPMQIAMRELREAQAILASIEYKQAKPRRVGSRPSAAQHRIEKTLAEITEKLNRLLGHN